MPLDPIISLLCMLGEGGYAKVYSALGPDNKVIMYRYILFDIVEQHRIYVSMCIWLCFSLVLSKPQENLTGSPKNMVLGRRPGNF